MTTPIEEPEQVSISAEEFRRLTAAREQLEAVDAERKRLAEGLGAATTDLAKLKEDNDRQLAEANERAAELEGQLLTDRKASTISSALLGVLFIGPESAEMARELIENRCEVTRGADGKIHVTDKKTGKPADIAIKEWLDSTQAASLLKPSTTGGAGSTGADRVPSYYKEEKPRLSASEQLLLNEKNRLKDTPRGQHHGLSYRP